MIGQFKNKKTNKNGNSNYLKEIIKVKIGAFLLFNVFCDVGIFFLPFCHFPCHFTNDVLKNKFWNFINNIIVDKFELCNQNLSRFIINFIRLYLSRPLTIASFSMRNIRKYQGCIIIIFMSLSILCIN